MLSNLLDKSLVRRLHNGRYDIHELLRQYAADQLAANKPRQTAAQSRFTAYYVALVETAAQQLTGSQQQTWLDRLEMEYDNIRAVLSWAINAADEETAVRLGAALGRFWWLRYRPLEGGNWLKQILALPGSPTDTRTRVMSYAGLLARQRRDYAEAEHWLTQSIRWQREWGQQLDLGRSLNELGMLFMDRGEFSRAQELFSEWLTVARALDFPHGISIALLNLGMVAHHQKAYNQAETFFQESLTMAHQLGLKTNEAMILNSYSMLLLDQEKLAEAKMRLSESLQLNQELDYKDGLSWAFFGLVNITHKMEQLELAATLVGVVDALRQLLLSSLPPTNQVYLDGITTDLHQRLGAKLFAAKCEIGRQMPLDEAVALAMAFCQIA
jgi:tetratricopeptide (TPR) repeat protein